MYLFFIFLFNTIWNHSLKNSIDLLLTPTWPTTCHIWPPLDIHLTSTCPILDLHLTSTSRNITLLPTYSTFIPSPPLYPYTSILLHRFYPLSTESPLSFYRKSKPFLFSYPQQLPFTPHTTVSLLSKAGSTFTIPDHPRPSLDPLTPCHPLQHPLDPLQHPHTARRPRPRLFAFVLASSCRCMKLNV